MKRARTTNLLPLDGPLQPGWLDVSFFSSSFSFAFFPWNVINLFYFLDSQLPTPHQLTQSITKIYNTGVSEDVLKSIGKTISSYPEGFKVHPVLEKILNRTFFFFSYKFLNWLSSNQK